MRNILLILLILPISTWAAEGGNEGGHGGSPEAIEFVQLAGELHTELSKPEHALLLESTDLNLKKLKQKIDTAIVVAKKSEEMILNRDGFFDEVDAINFRRENRIHIHRIRWNESLTTQKLGLILHEYLGLMNIELDLSRVSALYMQPIRATHERLLNEKKAKPTHFFGSCLSIVLTNDAIAKCTKNEPSNQNALSCASEEALELCSEENRSSCTIVDLEVKPASLKPSTETSISYCRATAKAKPN